MKKSINYLGGKTFLTILVASIFLASQGCGGGATEESKTTSESAAPAQPKDDGQGVGKFKDITLTTIDTKLAEQGKAVFEAKCVACHRVTDQKIVGPGLKGITKIRSAAWILNMITNPLEMTQKDPAAKELLAEHLTQMTFQDVSDEQAKELLEYLRMNDSEGAEQAKK
ncbi:MAG: cytochrome c [Bacteroidetes bacterium]|nr:cytochrome c [Bacteroidota bacterium]